MCGIVGVYGSTRASDMAYRGLFQLQHRGQDAAGMASADDTVFYNKSGLGLLREAISLVDLKQLPGRIAIGHVRYRTAGNITAAETQPFIADTKHGKLAIAHNGNFPLADSERTRLKERGFPVSTSSDTELAMHRIANASGRTLEDIVHHALHTFEGAYAMLLMTSGALVGFRDPWGYRPLFWGKVGDAWVFASETCALKHLGAAQSMAVEPGQVVTIDAQGSRVRQLFPKTNPQCFCSFEKVYITRPDSILDDEDVSQIRYRLGRALAFTCPVKGGADFVVPILDSGQWAAIGYHEESGIRYRPAMNRNHYIDRTFIKPEESLRDLAVEEKHGVSESWVRGNRIVAVDDSIIRARTIKRNVKLFWEAGATEVHIRISFPPTVSPCFHGVDMKTKEELYAATHSLDETCAYIGATSLGYLPRQQMLAVFGDPTGNQHCTSCLTGQYAMPVPFP